MSNLTPDSQSSLEKWVDWLLHLHAQEIDLGLDRIRQVAERMELLQPVPIVLTVAGTNGKGSSVAMLVSILQAAGYRVGAYTSPHIQCFNERIQLLGGLATDQQIVSAFDEIERGRQDTKLTYFEFSTLAALSVFKQAKLDVVVLEVGLGGRLDAVNVVDASAALITAIDIDHIDWLGDDRGQIAIEKAGVTRTGRVAVCSDPNPPATLATYAKTNQVPLRQLNQDFHLLQTDDGWMLDVSASSADWQGDFVSSQLPFPALRGDFQVQNAAGVVALLSAVHSSLPVSRQAVFDGLKKVKHAGRLETVVVNERNWLVDVAHNPQSARVLADYLQTTVDAGNYTAVFSVLSDKDAAPMIEALSPYIKKWLIADLAIPRASSAEQMKVSLGAAGVADEDIIVFGTVAESVLYCVQQQIEPVLVWGSFFTVSQVYQALEDNGVNE